MENDKYACLDWDTLDLFNLFHFFCKKKNERKNSQKYDITQNILSHVFTP